MILGPDPNAWRLATVREVIAETPRAVTLRIEAEDWPGHLAGQRVDVRLTAADGYQATRAYSLASPPSWPLVDVTVEEVEGGEVSPYLAGVVRPGDQFEVRGPIGGAFTWRPQDGGPVLLVGGGSGLVPLMAMVRAHAESGGDADVRVIVSARTSADVLWREELEALAADGVIRLHLTLTRETPPPGWAGSAGRIDWTMLRELGPPAAETPRLYLCGPSGFVDHAADQLLALGHAPTRIRAERFGPSA